MVQSFTAHMPLLAATSAFALGRRRWSSPQQCYLHCLRTLSIISLVKAIKHTLDWQPLRNTVFTYLLTHWNCQSSWNLDVLVHYYLFRECCSRCRFQRMTASPHPLRGVDSVHLQILLMGTRVDNVVHDLSPATITGMWLGETSFVQVSTTWALTCPETVHQRPCMTRDVDRMLVQLLCTMR